MYKKTTENVNVSSIRLIVMGRVTILYLTFSFHSLVFNRSNKRFELPRIFYLQELKIKDQHEQAVSNGTDLPLLEQTMNKVFP
jgi:hypothetical protein